MAFNLRLIISSALLLPLFISPPSLPVLAQDEQQIAEKVNCANPQTTVEMNICAGQEYKAADHKLNQVYRQLQSKLSGNQKQRITLAQLAWIKFRDANCDYERGEFEGGTMANPTISSCLAGMTEKRTKELENYLHGLESR